MGSFVAEVFARARRLRWPELPVLLLVLVGTGALWLFVEVADEVLEGETQHLDERILLALREQHDLSDPLGPRWLEELGRDMTALGGTGVLTLLTGATVLYLLLAGRPHTAAIVALAIVGGVLISSLSKAGFDRPRPDLVPHHSHVYTASFPSGHSMLAAVGYLTLGALLARIHRRFALKAFFIVGAVLVTLLVGLSRVYMGVHWPTDVLAGWSLGAAWATACWLAMLWLQGRGRVEDEGGLAEAAGDGEAADRARPDVRGDA